MTKNIGKLGLAVLALMLVGSQLIYAQGNNNNGGNNNNDDDEKPLKRKTVPEPATLTLMALGVAGVAAARRRRKSS